MKKTYAVKTKFGEFDLTVPEEDIGEFGKMVGHEEAVKRILSNGFVRKDTNGFFSMVRPEMPDFIAKVKE